MQLSSHPPEQHAPLAPGRGPRAPPAAAAEPHRGVEVGERLGRAPRQPQTLRAVVVGRGAVGSQAHNLHQQRIRDEVPQFSLRYCDDI